MEKNGTLGVDFLGDFFPARRADRAPLNPGDRVVIESFQGITAVVRPAENSGDPVADIPH